MLSNQLRTFGKNMSYKLIAPNTQKLRISIAYFDFLWHNHSMR